MHEALRTVTSHAAGSRAEASCIAVPLDGQDRHSPEWTTGCLESCFILHQLVSPLVSSSRFETDILSCSTWTVRGDERF